MVKRAGGKQALVGGAQGALALTLGTLNDFPIESRSLLARLHEEPPATGEQLRQLAQDYTTAFVKRAKYEDFVDGSEAEVICDHCLALLRWLDAHLEAGPEQVGQAAHRWVHAAVRYFVIEDDGDGDFSMGGLADDLAVVTTVARHLAVDLT